VFSPALADVATHRTDTLRLHVSRTSDTWVYARLTHAIPRYGGIVIGDRVRIVPPDAAADFVVTDDGSLLPAR